MELRQNYQISELLIGFNTDLQDAISTCCVSIYQCGKIKSPKLSTVSEAYGEDGVYLFMRAHLVKVCEFIGVKEKMSDWQMKATCTQMYGSCPELTLTEFILFCSRLRSGQYETFYGSVDPQRVLISFDDFLKDRKADIIAGKNEELENKRRIEDYQKSYDENVTQMMADGKLPFLKSLMKKGGQKGKSLQFYESIRQLINFKQNNS